MINLPSLIILLISFFLLYLYIIANKNYIINIILEFENKQNITQYEIKEFRKINSENILLDKKKYKRENIPDVSIIITIYNQANLIHKCLRSIQNQSLKNIEIIIIDDCSIDNSIEIIEAYQKDDDRITLIKHDLNEGKIKTRTDGIKIAKGKYITIIDGDDALIHKNILLNCLYISNLANLDIVEFKGSSYREGNYIGNVNEFKDINFTSNIIYQPELRTKFFKIKEIDSFRPIINRSIWGKFIRNKILQQTIIKIGSKYTEDYIQFYEDTLMAVALFQTAQSYFLMKEVGYYYSLDKLKINLPIKTNKICKMKTNGESYIKFLEFLAENTKNNLIEKQMLYHEIISINYYEKISILIENQFEILNNIFKRIIKSKYISTKQKEKIRTIKEQIHSKKI